MGNSNIPTQQRTQGIKKLTQQADKLSDQLQLDIYYKSIIRRIFVQTKQKHLIQLIHHKKQRNQKIQQFLDQIHFANLQILDSFYEHIVKNTYDITITQHQQLLTTKQIIPLYDRQIGICGSMDIMKQHQWSNISQAYANIIDLQQGIDNINNYQLYKEKGLQIIKKQQICFIILAGGKNIRYDLQRYKQCQVLTELPSQICMIELMLMRLQALGKLIDTTIYITIMVDSQSHKQQIKKIKNMKLGNSLYIQIEYIIQINYGCLDIWGRLVIDDNNRVYMHPNGSGDIWGNFQGKDYYKNGFNQFKYFQIFGLSNMLQHCFDCFMIGKLVVDQLPWITMSAYGHNTDDSNPVIFVNSDKSIQVRDPQQIGSGMDVNNLSQFPKQWQHIYLNNTVFSGKFIKQVVDQSKWQKYRKYHCKYKPICHRAPLSKYKSILTFQRQISDIFAISSIIEQQDTIYAGNKNVDNKSKQRGTIVLMNANEYYTQYYNKQDKIKGQVTLSQRYKQWLKLTKNNRKQTKEYKDQDYYQQKLKQICQIDPMISIEGQNLQQIIQQLSKTKDNIQYPLYIGPENYQLPKNPGNFTEQSKFTYVNMLPRTQ